MFNKSYNTRNSGRMSNPGNFVSAGEQFGGNTKKQQPQQPQQPQPQQQPQQQLQQQAPSNLQEVPQQLQNEDVDMKPEVVQNENEEEDMSSKNEDRPSWMKFKLAGVKKISNKERRRRQNETLRRLVTPKNALMVLNEMMPHEQIANQFKVDAAGTQFYSRNQHSFCADLTLEGTNYKGFGDNKLSARNSAAEQAIRDLIIKKMNKVITTEAPSGSQNGEETAEEEVLPMIQLASFALHKLFTEWESEGHRVPQLRPNNSSVSESGEAGEAEAGAEAAAGAGAGAARRPKAAWPRVLPGNAAAMHPCMLLTYMRPRLEYRELHVEGDRPQNMLFTMGVDVDGATYIGKAGNKKEARKQAAKAACTALFGTKFDEQPSADMPQN